MMEKSTFLFMIGQSIFQHKPIPGILEYHHFRFKKQTPGIVYCQKRLGGPITQINILKAKIKIKDIPSKELPHIIKPEGFSKDRQTYLYNDIRQFCKPGTEDLVVPLPT